MTRWGDQIFETNPGRGHSGRVWACLRGTSLRCTPIQCTSMPAARSPSLSLGVNSLMGTCGCGAATGKWWGTRCPNTSILHPAAILQEKAIASIYSKHTSFVVAKTARRAKSYAVLSRALCFSCLTTCRSPFSLYFFGSRRGDFRRVGNTFSAAGAFKFTQDPTRGTLVLLPFPSLN